MGSKLDINTATLEQIERIHGIGEARAREIVAYRKEHSGIRHIDELLDLPLFQDASPEDRQLLRDYFTVNPETLPVDMRGKININTADRSALERIRGIGEQRADILLEYRRRTGHFRSLDEIDSLPSFADMDPVERDAIKAHLLLE